MGIGQDEVVLGIIEKVQQGKPISLEEYVRTLNSMVVELAEVVRRMNDTQRELTKTISNMNDTQLELILSVAALEKATAATDTPTGEGEK